MQEIFARWQMLYVNCWCKFFQRLFVSSRSVFLLSYCCFVHTLFEHCLGKYCIRRVHSKAWLLHLWLSETFTYDLNAYIFTTFFIRKFFQSLEWRYGFVCVHKRSLCQTKYKQCRFCETNLSIIVIIAKCFNKKHLSIYFNNFYCLPFQYISKNKTKLFYMYLHLGTAREQIDIAKCTLKFAYTNEESTVLVRGYPVRISSPQSVPNQSHSNFTH